MPSTAQKKTDTDMPKVGPAEMLPSHSAQRHSEAQLPVTHMAMQLDRLHLIVVVHVLVSHRSCSACRPAHDIAAACPWR